MAKKTPARSINVQPTPAEFTNIARELRTRILENVKPRQLKHVTSQIDAMLEIAVYIGAQPNGAELAAQLIPNFNMPQTKKDGE